MVFAPAGWRSRFAPGTIITRARQIFPLGITPRLIISLAAVALLAGTANMIARESVHIIRTVTHSAAPSPSIPAINAQAVVAATMAEAKRGNALTLAVDNFRQVSLSRAEQNSPVGHQDYVAAKSALQVATLDYATGSPKLRGMGDYLDRGETVVRLADQRTQLRAAYVGHVKSIADRLQKSLDDAWTIFGRVIARQSLIQMRVDLDAIRQHAEPMLSDDERGGGNLGPLIADELQFSKLLKASQSGLTASEGSDWIRGVRKDFEALVALRGEMTALSRRYDQMALQFAEQSKIVSKEIAATTESVRPAHLRSPLAVIGPENSSADHGSAATSGDSVIETKVERSDPDAARLMALVTALVMLVIVAVSFFTVRSILIPVRRLVSGAKELANGREIVRVPRGGIRELDVVALSFNEMASRLEAVQRSYIEQQESLEDQVLQRTYKLQELAQQDPLTSLPNRRHLASLLNSALDCARRDNVYVGVYFLDIDNFKNINDSLGHAFGDRVLMSVANRLEELADGFGFVARLGGDEFTVVYENAKSINAIHELGWALARAFHKLMSVDDRELSISVSVGASIFPEHEFNADGLLRAADSALFRAKELGRSQLAIFTPELTTKAAVRFATEQGLRRAIECSEFELHYQPEIDAATSEIALVEALLRWRLPDGRIALPGEFLGVAEQSGLMTEINVWVLRAALEDTARWYHGDWPQVRVAINVSPRQLLDHRFVERILASLKELRVPATCIELELTEMVLQTGPTTIAALRELQSHGFGIALDDFGTGYSSLTSLEQLPLSRIKLDRSLVARIDTSARSAAIARAVIDLCADLGLQVTAEGIERPEQLAWFLGNQNILLQGYLLSEAVSFSDVAQVKGVLTNRMHDLFLSMPAPVRSSDGTARKTKFAVRS